MAGDEFYGLQKPLLQTKLCAAVPAFWWTFHVFPGGFFQNVSVVHLRFRVGLFFRVSHSSVPDPQKRRYSLPDPDFGCDTDGDVRNGVSVRTAAGWGCRSAADRTSCSLCGSAVFRCISSDLSSDKIKNAPSDEGAFLLS